MSVTCQLRSAVLCHGQINFSRPQTQLIALGVTPLSVTALTCKTKMSSASAWAGHVTQGNVDVVAEERVNP